MLTHRLLTHYIKQHLHKDTRPALLLTPRNMHTYKLRAAEVASQPHGHLGAGFILNRIIGANCTALVLFLFLHFIFYDEVGGWWGNVWF